MAGVEAWRRRHPKASLQGMSAAPRARGAAPRPCLRQDVALASRAADVSQARGPNRPVCPPCGTSVECAVALSWMVCLRHLKCRAPDLSTQGPWRALILKRNFTWPLAQTALAHAVQPRRRNRFQAREAASSTVRTCRLHVTYGSVARTPTVPLGHKITA
jgi:hypothetical protein